MRLVTLSILAWLLWPDVAAAYPIYDSESTGIRRLEHARLAHDGTIAGRRRVPGELLTLEQVDLRLLHRRDMEIPVPDTAFTAQVVNLLGANADRYGIAVLDLSKLDHPRYAQHNSETIHNPGSVGKIVVATALFQALADLHPDDLASRRKVLRDTWITADDFIIHDSHKVRFWDPRTRGLVRRPIQIGDRASLWEFVDWMLSASSNAAASTVIKQAMLLVRFGRGYPVEEATAMAFFAKTPRAQLGDVLEKTLHTPLQRSGIDLNRLRQGSFFTATGKRKVPGTRSYTTSRALMTYLLRLEQGRIVDEFSSREIKRLLYMTERRIRYASSPALHDAAVYFKSGSLYKCQPEPGFVCRKYHGNRQNLMHSVAIIESPAADRRLYYFVTLVSNVLRKNSAVDHQTLATRIHRLIEAAHAK
jgi:hypothetical protein